MSRNNIKGLVERALIEARHLFDLSENAQDMVHLSRAIHALEDEANRLADLVSSAGATAPHTIDRFLSARHPIFEWINHRGEREAVSANALQHEVRELKAEVENYRAARTARSTKELAS
jgi:hypothetical protein